MVLIDFCFMFFLLHCRVRAPQQAGSIASREAANKAPPPSQLDDPMVDPAPIGAIQAVRYHESGEIQEVTYSELKPQEKQEVKLKIFFMILFRYLAVEIKSIYSN